MVRVQFLPDQVQQGIRLGKSDPFDEHLITCPDQPGIPDALGRYRAVQTDQA